MQVQEVATLNLTDLVLEDEVTVIIQVSEQGVLLCISEHLNGDVEVMLRKVDCIQVIEALQRAIQICS